MAPCCLRTAPRKLIQVVFLAAENIQSFVNCQSLPGIASLDYGCCEVALSEITYDRCVLGFEAYERHFSNLHKKAGGSGFLTDWCGFEEESYQSVVS